MKQPSTTRYGRPVLDQDSFQKLLAAAYVMQEHRDRLRAEEKKQQEKGPAADYMQTLAEIVETQHLIQTQQLNLQAALELIVKRLQQITQASGAAIGILEREELVYRAASGSAAQQAGARVQMDSALSALCLRTGELLRCPATSRDSRLNPAVCRQRGVGSFLAVPLYHEGRIAGAMELQFMRPDALAEQDVRTCQLMAGLVMEALAQAAEVEWKQTLAAERAALLETLGKVTPQLERLAEEPGVAASAVPGEPAAEVTRCEHCGQPVAAGELYCPQCGAEPAPERPPGSYVQSKLASLWYMHLAAERKDQAAAAHGPQPDEAGQDGIEDSRQPVPQIQDPLLLSAEALAQRQASLPQVDSGVEAAALPRPAEFAWVQPEAFRPNPSPWTSAARTREWFDSLNLKQRGTWLKELWQNRRADVYLAVAVVLVTLAFALEIGGRNSGPSDAYAPRTVAGRPSAGGARPPHPQEPQLTPFERLLVSLGLAEAPPLPVYLGNPGTRVWLDLQTALYYCPGADLYGKTANGKFTTQRDAQQDQFEPAYRKACD